MHSSPLSVFETSHAGYHLLVDSVREYAIFMLDAEGRVVTWNQGAERIKGYSAEEITGRHFSCFYPLEDIQRGKPDNGLRTAVREGKFEDEGWRVRKDGSRFWASVVITALFDPSGRLAGFAKVTRDMTERKQHLDELRAAKARLESQMQERAAQWKAVFDHGPAGMIKVGLDGRYLEVNPTFCEQVGYSAEELKRLSFRDISTAADTAEAEIHLQKLLAGEVPSYTREKVLIRKDGARIYMDVSLALVSDADGRPLYLLGVGTDITERKRAEAIRAESEAAFRSIFEHAPVSIVHADLNGRIIRANRKYAEITGYAPEEIAGQTLRSVAHPDDLAQNLALRARLLAGEIPNYAMVKRLVRKDGATAWTNLNVSVGRDPVTGRVTHTISILEDITAQKKAEQALAESRQRFALAAQTSGLGNWEFDTERQLFTFSANKAAMLGYPPEELRMTVPAFMEHVHPADRHMIAEKVRQVTQEGRIEVGAEYRVLGLGGEERWIEARGQLIRHYGENGRRYMGVSLDVTSRKRAELQLREFSVHLQKAREDERKHLAREIHDELGGALTAIKFDLAAPTRHDAPVPEAKALRHETSVTQIDAAIASLRRIISDLRPSVLDDIGLWAALEWQAQEFETRAGILCVYSMKGPEIEVEPETATELFRMVQEALTNVRRHAQASRVALCIEVTGEEISIRVRDNGVGIACDRLKSNHSYGLLGMQERARQVGGEVRVTGRTGRGTTVRIRLPLLPGDRDSGHAYAFG